MGQNLVLNMLDHGFKVCVFNRTVSKVDAFVCREGKRQNLCGARTAAELVDCLAKPRKIIILVKAGQAVDDFIEILIPLLEPGDIIIDGGNSAFTDTDRRCKYLESIGLLFVGSGVSGGEEGARTGPSLMPGGHPEAWPHIKNIFQSISAKTPKGEPCCDWASSHFKNSTCVGSGGAGHFVKMVHNGIEYGDMQLISEAYFLLTKYLCLTAAETAKVFDEWNKGELESYLIQITRDILAFNDESGTPLLEKIRDVSGQKGTGKWTTICGLERGCPITLIAESVFSRSLSSMKRERVEASKILSGPPLIPEIDKYGKTKLEEKGKEVELVRRALYASKIVSYAQGFMLLQKACEEFGWDLDLGAIALIWRGGCVIRSRFLGDIKEAYTRNPSLTNLLLDPFFKNAIDQCQESWRSIVCMSVKAGIPVPGFSSALAFFDAFRSARLPANLIQAQRDYFGAHLYELEASPGTWHHTDWTGGGGTTTASSYQA
ncbi:6-phosphogluconate dehydrogenase decarboxylating [Taenia solium]|eukprot:TsM_000662800 transcript=TsM_000662800 gene=TsM_000662800